MAYQTQIAQLTAIERLEPPSNMGINSPVENPQVSALSFV
jgi:hypothetical protein